MQPGASKISPRWEGSVKVYVLHPYPTFTEIWAGWWSDEVVERPARIELAAQPLF